MRQRRALVHPIDNPISAVPANADELRDRAVLTAAGWPRRGG